MACRSSGRPASRRRYCLGFLATLGSRSDVCDPITAAAEEVRPCAGLFCWLWAKTGHPVEFVPPGRCASKPRFLAKGFERKNPAAGASQPLGRSGSACLLPLWQLGPWLCSPRPAAPHRGWAAAKDRECGPEHVALTRQRKRRQLVTTVVDQTDPGIFLVRNRRTGQGREPLPIRRT
jgi:hypothetical protein